MVVQKLHAPWRGFFLLLASLLSGLLLTGLFGALVSVAAQQPQPLPSLQVKIVSSPALSEGNTSEQAPETIWTDDLLRQAKPYPMPQIQPGRDLLSAAPDGPAGWAPAVPPGGPEQDFLRGLRGLEIAAPQDSTYVNPYSYSLFPFRAVGRVFFIWDGSAYACSASVIGEYAIWTAGHCVHPGNGDPNGWYTNWIFIPAYKDNLRPYGTWSAAYIYTTDQWMNNEDIRYDFGVVIVKPLNGKTIRQTVGSLGFAWNQAVDQPRTAMGYPLKPSSLFDGQKQVISSASYVFTDSNFTDPPPYPIGMPSLMQEGASGGPWMLNHAITTTAGYNLLNGGNSYIYRSLEAIYSPYFGAVSKTMYDCATQSTLTHRTCGNEAELVLTQSARSTVRQGEAFTYTLAIQNQGALSGAHFVLTDTLGLGTSLISARLPGGSCSSLGRQVFCTLALLPRWSTITATLAVTAPQKIGATVNLAGARTDQNDFTPQDNVGVPLTVIVGKTMFFPVIRR